MGARVDPVIGGLLRERKIQRFRASRETILKELEGARYDLDKARVSLDQGDYKWSTVQAYYSMFHSARALLYSKGYREKSHSALLEALTSLFVRTGLLERDYVDDLRDAKDMRESADYGMVFSEEGARTLIINADKFLRKAAETLES
ncbi:HEPN domain-containing protein [archaeon]|nr:HEPN domain-containing protein [archaeon]